MEENNKKQSLENFTKIISKRFSIDENALLFCLYNDQKNYWNTLFNLINKKSELKKTIESDTKDENGNKENGRQTFNKEDIIKEIENYLKENPDEVDEMWEKFKDNKIESANNDDNNNNHEENIERQSLNIKKIISNENNKVMKRPNSPQKRKKNIIKIGNQKINFSIEVTDSRRHQSILGQLKKDNSIPPKQEIKNSFTKIYKKNSIVKPQRKYFFPQKNKNKNRHSVFLQINSSNFDYVPKKFFNQKNNRKSISGQKNICNTFRFSLHRSLEKSSIDSQKKKQNKKVYNKTENKGKVRNSITNEEIKEDKLEKSDDKIEEKNEDKSDYESDKSNKEKNKEEQGYKKDENFFNFDDSDSEKKEKANNNKDAKIKEENNNKKDIKPQINKEEDEMNAFPIYKNKNCVFIIKKQKPKPKPVAKPKSNLKKEKKIKKYLNLSECHQIYLCLNINNNKINNKNKSIHFSDSSPKISEYKNKSINLSKTKNEYTNSQLKNNASNNDEQNSDDKSNDMSSQKNIVRKLIFYDEIFNFNSSGKQFNSTIKKNQNSSLNTNIKPINNYRTLRFNNNHSSYKNKVNNYKSENKIKFIKLSKYNSKNKTKKINKSQKSFIPKKIVIINNKNKNKKIKNDNDQEYSYRKYKNYMNKSSKDFYYKNNSHKYINADITYNKEIKNYKIKKAKLNNSINGKSFKPQRRYYLRKYKEEIENLMKNDNSIFSEERKQINASFVQKSKKKRNIKNNNTLSHKKLNLTMNNNIIKKIRDVKPQIKYYNTKINKYNYKNSNKKNFHSSTDKIYRK